MPLSILDSLKLSWIFLFLSWKLSFFFVVTVTPKNTLRSFLSPLPELAMDHAFFAGRLIVSHFHSSLVCARVSCTFQESHACCETLTKRADEHCCMLQQHQHQSWKEQLRKVVRLIFFAVFITTTTTTDLAWMWLCFVHVSTIQNGLYETSVLGLHATCLSIPNISIIEHSSFASFFQSFSRYRLRRVHE